MPGAKVAGAWILPRSTIDSQTVVDPASFTSGLDYLRAAYGRDAFAPSNALPRRLEPGESAELFILWDIVDCRALSESRQPEVRLGSILGSTTSERLPDWAGPGWDRDTLRLAGTCPT